MQSKVLTINQYLGELPADRRVAIETVRKVILEKLPDGYQEIVNGGMITYQVPLTEYPDTYNKKPLMYAALASQKNHMAVYLMGIYLDENARLHFESEYKATGKRFDAGKSCVRFRKLDDLPLSLIGEQIAEFPLDEFVARVKKVSSSQKIKNKR